MRKHKTLTITRETVRRLSTADLRQVAGGADNSAFCSKRIGQSLCAFGCSGSPGCS